MPGQRARETFDENGEADGDEGYCRLRDELWGGAQFDLVVDHAHQEHERPAQQQANHASMFAWVQGGYVK